MIDCKHCDGYEAGYSAGLKDAETLNNAINIIKTVCKDNNTCNTCPMNLNCNEQPAKWKEVY